MTDAMTDQTIDIPFDPPPRHCVNPRCRVPLKRAFPQCPACQEPLTPAALKARADRAAAAGLGLVKPPVETELPLVRLFEPPGRPAAGRVRVKVTES